MIKFSRFVLAFCFTLSLPWALHAEAPVVDDSENFALLDSDQGTDYNQSAKRVASRSSYHNEERAFAHETTNSVQSEDSASLINKVQGLQQEIQELRGQLEVQAHDLKQLQQQQMTFYNDLDTRLRNTSTPPKTVTNAPSVAPTPITATTPIATPAAQAVATTSTNNMTNTVHKNPADEEISYLAAYELVKRKQFDEAIKAMQSFVNQYPNGGYAANAEYWLGELYMVKQAFPEAIQHFDTVLQKFPNSNKAAASLLKSGYAFAASGQRDAAIARLQQVISMYPNTNTAQLAQSRLNNL